MSTIMNKVVRYTIIIEDSEVPQLATEKEVHKIIYEEEHVNASLIQYLQYHERLPKRVAIQ